MYRLLVLLVMLLAAPAGASGPGAIFLMIFPDARSTSLGGCGTASADFAANAYYNPAGLSATPDLAAHWSHANWLPGLYPGMNYSFFGAAYRLNRRLGTGLNLTYLSTGETDVINEKGEYLGRYRTYDLALQVSAGYQLLPQLSAGAGGKGIYSMLVPGWVWEMMPEFGTPGSPFTVAADIGCQYRPWDWLGVGLALNNLGPDIKYSLSGESDPLPAILRFGWEVQPRIPGPVEVRLISDVWRDLVTEMRVPPRGAVDNRERLIRIAQEMQFGAGVELRFARIARVRFGYFEDYIGQRGGMEAVWADGRGPTRISLWRFLAEKGWSEPRFIGFVWGGGVEYRGFAFDIGVDEGIYAFPTRNVRFQMSWQLRPR